MSLHQGTASSGLAAPVALWSPSCLQQEAGWVHQRDSSHDPHLRHVSAAGLHFSPCPLTAPVASKGFLGALRRSGCLVLPLDLCRSAVEMLCCFVAGGSSRWVVKFCTRTCCSWLPWLFSSSEVSLELPYRNPPKLGGECFPWENLGLHLKGEFSKPSPCPSASPGAFTPLSLEGTGGKLPGT